MICSQCRAEMKRDAARYVCPDCSYDVPVPADVIMRTAAHIGLTRALI